MKDRLIQTRVPERLESVLKEEAKKRRLTVSHLIRNMLEDTLHLVDTVVTGAGDLVNTSVDIAEQVAFDAGKIASSAREAVRSRSAEPPAEPVRTPGPAADRAREPVSKSESPEPSKAAGTAPPSLDHVLAWNPVVVNKPSACASCGKALDKGENAHLGVSQDPSAPPTWLCSDCLARL